MLINGQSVHAHLDDSFKGDWYDYLCSEGGGAASDAYFEEHLTPYLDNNGCPIPTSKCICGAYYPGECGCACDSWTEADGENE